MTARRRSKGPAAARLSATGHAGSPIYAPNVGSATEHRGFVISARNGTYVIRYKGDGGRTQTISYAASGDERETLDKAMGPPMRPVVFQLLEGKLHLLR